MKRALFILLLLSLLVGATRVGMMAAPPADDSYYWPGGSYKVKSAQMPIEENEWKEEQPAAQTTDSVCKPLIRFTSIQDTVVTAIIKRCE